MKKNIIMSLIFIISVSINVYSIDYSDGLLNFKFSENKWNSNSKKIGTNILRAEGLFNECILFLNNKENRSQIIIGKYIFSDYYPPEHFKDSTLSRARTHYGLDKKWGSSKFVTIDSKKFSYTLGRSNSYTSNNFPFDTTSIWIEMLDSYYNKEKKTIENIIYVVYFRIPNREWNQLSKAYIDKEVINNIKFSSKRFISIPQSSIEGVNWVVNNKLDLGLGQKQNIVRIKRKQEPITTVNRSWIIKNNELNKLLAVWHAPINVFKLKSIDGENVNGTLSYDFKSNSLLLNVSKKLITVKWGDVKAYVVYYKTPLFQQGSIHLKLGFTDVKKGNLDIAFSGLDKSYGKKEINDFILKIRKINKLYKK